ncbi:hypothetical protein D9615_000725 [Tricholomella constricta]|uniref:Right handed beta helix domain-containing protein n=1 Tax=Tricholomella constricta TaxID=117010 RepID=A0A8H5HQS6_9AGAR|nr:hypothetical protein D9615_000725 [Tricholomella constricta]
MSIPEREYKAQPGRRRLRMLFNITFRDSPSSFKAVQFGNGLKTAPHEYTADAHPSRSSLLVASRQNTHSPSINKFMDENNATQHCSKPHRTHKPRDGKCEPADPANTVTDRLNALLQSSGPGYILSLCANQSYMLQAPLNFAAPQQEISTLGYPTGDERAILVVNGPVADGQGHTTAVNGVCLTCSGVKLRNVQIDGTRRGAPTTEGGGNIEMGGENSDQLIEYVRSYDPRSWSCLHIAEGSLNCNNATVQNNDIGPCGSDMFQQWADGISMSCRNSVVRNNMIQGATDGGIVVFGSPGTQIYNNTIWQTLLGGINMVDYEPFSGDFTGTIVTNNTILGGFATDSQEPSDVKGNNFQGAIIKIGIAIGPRTWFGDKFGNNISHSGVVKDNQFGGALSYAIAITSAHNFTVENNILVGNTSFIGARGPNCSETDSVPAPAPFIVDSDTTEDIFLQPGFQTIADGDALTCVLPPNGGDYWPFGTNPSNTSHPTSAPTPEGGTAPGRTAGIAVGVIVGVLTVGLAVWFIRKWALKRAHSKYLYGATSNLDK